LDFYGLVLIFLLWLYLDFIGWGRGHFIKVMMVVMILMKMRGKQGRMKMLMMMGEQGWIQIYGTSGAKISKSQ